MILDFSASIAVSRHCARSEVKARHISAFLNPAGNSLTLTAEDEGRKFRLDWLEMLHYRAVLQEPTLAESLHPPDGRFRYGNSCRDVSTQLAQDDVAIWAGTASKAIRQISLSKEARVRIYMHKTDDTVFAFEQSITPLLEAQLGNWTIRFDEFVLGKLATSRKSKLPNETGGVLLGHFDTQRNLCSIIDIIESPPDSQEWPTSYIRGSNGLLAKVRKAEAGTLEQIGYVGEWHSHPKGAAVHPSGDDLKAYAWLCDYLLPESLPAIMLIIGDRSRFCLVSVSPGSPATRRKHHPRTK